MSRAANTSEAIGWVLIGVGIGVALVMVLAAYQVGAFQGQATALPKWKHGVAFNIRNREVSR